MAVKDGHGFGSAAIVAVSVAASGVLLGIAWYLLAPPLPLRKVEQGLAYISPDPEQPVAADGWFTLLGLAFGVFAAVLVWVLAHRSRGPLQLFGLLFGAIGAGALAWQLGKAIDVDAYERAKQNAPIGTIVEKPIDLSASSMTACLPTTNRCVTTRAGDLLVPAMGSAVTYSLLAGWSRWPHLRREEPDESFSSAMEPGPTEPGSPERPVFP